MTTPSPLKFINLRPVRTAALVFAGGLLFTLLFAAQASRTTTTRLNLNENSFGPSPLVAPALQGNLKDLYRYTTAEEAAALREQLAKKEGVSPDQIILGDLLEALGLHLSLTGGAGGEFIYSVPGYPALVDAAARVGGVVVGVPLDAQLENDLPAIAAKVTDRTRAVFLVNPHNPSGTVSDAEKFAVFLRSVSSRALVVVDEAYLEFSDDYAGRTAVALTREGANVLVYRTFAKAYGLAALPLGYAVAPRPIAELLRKQGLGGHHDVNRLALTAVLASLRDGGFIERVRASVATERVRWHSLLDELKLKHTNSQANFVYFDAGGSREEVIAALQAADVIVGRAFPPYQNWIRITIGRSGENERARTALRKALGR